MPPKIIFEDSDMLFIDKPPGLQVHPARVSGKKGDEKKERPNTLTDWLVEKYPAIKGVGDGPGGILERPGIVHRLDRETSGVMVVAKNQPAFDFLKEQFQSKKAQKTYLAIVRGVFKLDRGVIDVPIGIVNGTLKRSTRSLKMVKEAVTEYLVLKQYEGWSLVELRPKTGRTHQIRVHMAHLNHPLAGDKLYGGKNQPVWAPRTMLHALSLEVDVLSGGRVKIVAEEPLDFKEALTTLQTL
jgi:23S rRNA pseudouridine1911/1915/1917 synthase